MKKIIATMFLLLSIVGCNSSGNSMEQSEIEVKNGSSIQYFDLKVKYSGWQGVATDGEYIYITSDRDENFELKNRISVYSMDGKYVKEFQNAYSKTDGNGLFMSFGDCTIIDGNLYATVYNYNSGAKDLISRVVKYSIPDLKIISEYDIGEGTAESVVKQDENFWVAYNDRNFISKFDQNFTLIQSYPLSQKFEEEGGYQGIFFEGNELYGNIHGSNKHGEKYAQGLDHYHFDGNQFKFMERIKPPVYGAGQGIEENNGKYYWADRPSNRIIITEYIKLADGANEIKIGK